MQRHGLGLKDIPDAIAIRNHVLTCFEQAMLEPDAERRRSLLTFIVVGAGRPAWRWRGRSRADPAGPGQRLSSAQHQDVRILLLEATDQLLAALPKRLRERRQDAVAQIHRSALRRQRRRL